MTGRDLIVYILTNHLENAEIRNGKLMVSGNDYMKDEQVASILGVGMATIRVRYENDCFEGTVREDGVIYIPKDEVIRILSERFKEAGVRI